MKQIVKCFCALLLGGALLIPASVFAQVISVRIERGTLDQAFQQIMRTTTVQLVYNTDMASRVRCQAHVFRGKDITEVLDALLAHTSLTYTEKNGIYTIVRKPRSVQQGSRHVVSGKVFDEAGEPVIGASVLLKGTRKGMITDMNGGFAIPGVSGEKVTLLISFLGKKTIEVDMKPGVEETFTLEDDNAMLDEVVVTGYQDIAKEKMTGSVAIVRAEDLATRYVPNIMNNLEGRVAGLSTYGGEMTIRGTSSLYAETSPLLVVDGVPIEGKIEDLNPYDIESVNVLKDAAATAIYGARASNGIIVVTTKNAKEKGKIDIDFSANLTIWEKKNMDYADNFYLTPEQQVDIESDYWNYYFFDNDGEVADPLQSTLQAIESGTSAISPIQYAYYRLAKGEISCYDLHNTLDALKKNNFAKEYGDNIYKQQILQQYNLSLRSRADKFQSNLTLNYKFDNSGQINSDKSSLNINYKGIYDVASWLTATFSFNAIHDKSVGPGYDYNSSYTNPWAVPAYERMYNEDGSANLFYYWYDGNPYWSSKGAEGFHESILGAFDGVLHLRRGDTPLFRGFHLIGNGSHPFKQHHAEAVYQEKHRILQILAGLRHGVIHQAMKGIVVKLSHGIPLQPLRNGLENILRRRAAGGQAVNGIGMEDKTGAIQLPGHKVRRSLKKDRNVFMGQFPGIHGIGSGIGLFHKLTSKVVCPGFPGNIP